MSHILILIDGEVNADAALATATEVRERLNQGDVFEDLAREYSQDPVSAAEGGDLGWATPGDYPEAFEEALLALEPGEISTPVRTEFGVHLIRLDELRRGARQEFEDVRDDLFDELRTQAAADEFYAVAERLDDLALENPGNLTAVASELGRELRSIDNFTRIGGDPLGYDPEIVNAAFSLAVLEDGENSPLIELADERAVVVSVAEHRPSATLPFEAARERVEAALRIDRGADLARARGEAVLERLRAGESFADVADEFSFAPPEAVTLTRAARDVTPELLAAMYRAPQPPEGEPEYHGQALAGGGYAVFRLDAVTPGRPEVIPQDQRDQRKQLLAQQAGNNAAAALFADLRAAADVVIAPGLFDQPEPL